MNKDESRQRRARQTRIRIAEALANRLTVIRSNSHISAQVYSPCGTKVLAAASTMEKELRQAIKNGGNAEAAKQIGKLVAERAVKAGIVDVAFDRSGHRYHGRIKALAEAAREAGLKFAMAMAASVWVKANQKKYQLLFKKQWMKHAAR